MEYTPSPECRYRQETGARTSPNPNLTLMHYSVVHDRSIALWLWLRALQKYAYLLTCFTNFMALIYNVLSYRVHKQTDRQPNNRESKHYSRVATAEVIVVLQKSTDGLCLLTYFHCAPAAVLHQTADVSCFSACSNERSYIVVVELFQLQT